MSAILVPMFYELSVLITIAFIISRLPLFKNLIIDRSINLYHKIILSIIFGLFGIIGTYTGISIDGALANGRAIGVIIGGLLGGPFVGVLSGLIAGLHRYLIDLGGFTAISCAISTIVEAIIAGFLSFKFKGAKNKFLFAFTTGLLNETLQMIIILLTARPYTKALHLVKIIWLPMSFANSLGIGIFILIIESIFIEKEKILANQALVITEIADRMMKYFKDGYNETSALSAAKIIKKLTGVDAVAFTDKEKILAHVGIGNDHHKCGDKLHTQITKNAISTGRIKIAQTKNEIECDNLRCSLKSAVISPIYKGKEIVGVFKMYKIEAYAISDIDVKLAQGLSRLISTQLEIHDIENKEKLLDKARFKALQAQINPHFLFNSLNTIMSLCRTKPLMAREVLFNLSLFLRRNMEIDIDLISIDKEIDHVKSFVYIQKARFGNKINVNYNIEDNLNFYIPPLTIQPLVENSIKHGLLKRDSGGTVDIIIKNYKRGYMITVKDDGIGTDEEYIKSILNKDNKCNEKIGLVNVNKRLQSYFGSESSLKFKSKVGQGTTISFYIPQGGNCKK
ncbi:LytS/YhcK type 5TM receptor domain-containing protein [Thermoanaerobacterium sp. RBIITD]|uniref:LytS/YhcK type 5TM receptor domain-containing protein n=1 Tax=Thermoanaerobacterium sp. RBIITD TaxID=1550240 RepID=UPI000BB7E1A6|nr:LytS/YhcK type 5TM receptor domain-containing protein [Thermoanaerobacterium sp. RBIITD]SNX55085.1 two-component system, LytT family, sensor histidine kinase LytS [Thermoanaerobacterium sp. RBIITD]